MDEPGNKSFVFNTLMQTLCFFGFVLLTETPEEQKHAPKPENTTVKQQALSNPETSNNRYFGRHHDQDKKYHQNQKDVFAKRRARYVHTNERLLLRKSSTFQFLPGREEGRGGFKCDLNANYSTFVYGITTGDVNWFGLYWDSMVVCDMRPEDTIFVQNTTSCVFSVEQGTVFLFKGVLLQLLEAIQVSCKTCVVTVNNLGKVPLGLKQEINVELCSAAAFIKIGEVFSESDSESIQTSLDDLEEEKQKEIFERDIVILPAETLLGMYSDGLDLTKTSNRSYWKFLGGGEFYVRYLAETRAIDLPATIKLDDVPKDKIKKKRQRKKVE